MVRGQHIIPIERIASCIYLIRGEKVMLDSDLAELYGAETRALVQAVKRNAERFPEDFMFQLVDSEFQNLRSQIVTLKAGRGQHRQYLPLRFHRTGRGHAVQRTAQRPGHRGEHRNHARVRPSA